MAARSRWSSRKSSGRKNISSRTSESNSADAKTEGLVCYAKSVPRARIVARPAGRRVDFA
jgi:hypothetical protein